MVEKNKLSISSFCNIFYAAFYSHIYRNLGVNVSFSIFFEFIKILIIFDETFLKNYGI